MSKSRSATRPAVLSDRAWAETVAAAIGLQDAVDVDRVQMVLTETGLAAGRPPAMQHQLKVTGVYFSGIKVIRSDSEEVEVEDGSTVAAVETGGVRCSV